MIRLRNYVIWMAAAALLWGNTAQADGPAPPRTAQAAPADPAAPGPAAPAPAGPDGLAAPTAPTAPTAPEDPAGVSDAALARLAEGESIEIFDERPDKPFDRDTEVRLTGAELAARGATDLATALALLPEINVRDAGRGGYNIDIRGARKGDVTVLIDGVVVSDPYYGTFDVSSIPITDIVQIRVATTPQSPIDGPGGPGGVIEVHTRDAIGPQMVIGRVTGSSLPIVGATASARIPLARHLALRLSASGLGGAHDFDLPGDATLADHRYAATGSGRLEYRDGDLRIAADGFVDDRHYLSPPSDVLLRSTIVLIDRETTARASAKVDDKIGTLQVQGEVSTHYLERMSRLYLDPSLTSAAQIENLKALRSGATVLVTQPFLRDFRWAVSTSVDFEKAAVSDIMNSTVRGNTTLLEPAAALQYEHRRFRADLSAGVALPFGVGARPWPEAKAVAKYRLIDDLELTATGAYKGRVPSLRERFQTVGGNPNLAPEQTAHAELRAVEHIADRLHLELAPYYKHAKGTITTSPNPMDMGKLVNLGTIDFWGADALARVTPIRMLELGGGYEYVRARSVDPSGASHDDPLNRLPHHRWDGWIQVRPDPRYSALARVVYFGESIDQGVQVDGYATLQANLSAQITRQYLAVLNVDDLTDVRPQTRAGYHTAGRVVSLVIQGTWE
jgi:outer membrane receptor protein involved in Fe transport